MSLDRRAVVVTGLGVLSPIGCGKEAFWAAVLAGVSGIADIRSIDTSGFRSKRGCEIKEPVSLPSEDGVVIGRASRFAVRAAEQAIEDAKLTVSDVDTRRIGVSVGTTGGEIRVLEKMDSLRHPASDAMVPEALYAAQPCSTISANVARRFRCGGPNVLMSTACAAGNYAIGYAADVIRRGGADVMLAGGADPFSRVTHAGFCRIGAVTPDLCQPFDKNRKGIIVGEGAGILVLESEEHARQRGARPYARVLGYGLSCDAFDPGALDPSGQGVVVAMRRALATADVALEEVGYICAHGTGTPLNDRVETLAVKEVFGARASRVPMSSIKSMLGHTMGAASAIEAIACVLALRDGMLPPTINYETPDPECDLDCVPNTPKRSDIEVALNNAFAFGGNNSCLVLGKAR
jgi:3-oxoacyl-[acyl-carrier-protein] synthase II